VFSLATSFRSNTGSSVSLKWSLNPFRPCVHYNGHSGAFIYI